LDDLENKLDTDFKKVRQNHHSLLLSRVPEFKIIR